MTLNGSGVDETNASSVWTDSGGSVNLLARAGSAAPGVGEGVTFTGLEVPAIASSGEIAFFAGLAGAGIDTTNNTGLWSTTGGSLHPVVREGWAAPGTAEGTTFSSFYGDLAVDSAGQAAFTATLAGMGIDSTNDNGIWQERGGNLTLLARRLTGTGHRVWRGVQWYH